MVAELTQSYFESGAAAGPDNLDSCSPQCWTRPALLDLHLFVPLEVYDVRVGLGWVCFGLMSWCRLKKDID
jgi:hypothetical protein